jgi:hypothetical protein
MQMTEDRMTIFELSQIFGLREYKIRQLLQHFAIQTESSPLDGRVKLVSVKEFMQATGLQPKRENKS